MSVHVGTTTFTTRQPLDSVGLVCACGRAVAGIEGVVAQCSGCGAQYIITVVVIRGSRKRP